jgi:antitoxin (DNA-binding transcriptional repressor) of toxin-antitoxin stability system
MPTLARHRLPPRYRRVVSAAVDARDPRDRNAVILQRLREDGEPVDVTDQGRVVARLIPVERLERPRPTREGIEAWLRRLDGTGEEIGTDWLEGVSAVEAVREPRREL